MKTLFLICCLFFVVSSVAVIYGVDDNIKLSGTTGKVWRAPTFIDLYYPVWSNPDLKHEKGLSSDLGIE
ncbi:MAG: TonB-dependent receptor [Endomicrobium sp.]|jgi:outer membrane cobalamin receptor|nr:TonB-dependent receptor [Endomicrobium sp.]